MDPSAELSEILKIIGPENLPRDGFDHKAALALLKDLFQKEGRDGIEAKRLLLIGLFRGPIY